MLATVLCAVAVAGCGGGDDDGGDEVGGERVGGPEPPPVTQPTTSPRGGSNDVKACALLTPARISDELGVPIDPGKEEGAGVVVNCRYSSPEVPGFGFLLQVYPQNGKAIAAATKAAVSNVQSVSGVGDSAFYSEGAKTLGATKGDVFVLMTFGGEATPQLQGRLRTLMEAVLPKV